MKFNPTLHKLSNGITVFLDPMDLETVNFKIHFNTGPRDELPHEYGLTHFCEHMLLKGTPRFPTPKAMDEYLDYHGGTKNASTGNASLEFYGRILAENINLLIEFWGDLLQNSLFVPEKIEIERKVIADELRGSLDNPGRQLATFVSKKIFDGATYMTEKTCGTLENINGFTREQMLDFISRRLSAKNCIIAISGKINDTDSVLKCLEKTFAFLPTVDVSENTNIKYTPGVFHNSKPEKKNVMLRIYFPDLHQDTFENIFENKAVGKYERYMVEELYEVIRRENGLVYSFSGVSAGSQKFSVVGFGTETGADNIKKVVALIAKTSHRIYTENKISEDDLERYRCKNRLSNADWLESASQRCDKLISFYRYYNRVYDESESIRLGNSVSVSDAVKYSRGYFDGPISIITQGADFDADLQKIWTENFK